jgi:hypothetical protein
MKTLTLIIITLLLATPCFAGSGSVAITLSGTAGGGSSKGKVGDSTQESTGGTATAGYVLVWRSQASASGSLNTAYLYHADTTAAAAKLIIFNSAATTPQSADSLLSASSEINGSTSTGWKSASTTGTVTSGSWYWVGYIIPSSYSNWSMVCNSTISMFYKTLSNSNLYTDPVTNFATMGTGWTEAASSCPCSGYADTP